MAHTTCQATVVMPHSYGPHGYNALPGPTIQYSYSPVPTRLPRYEPYVSVSGDATNALSKVISQCFCGCAENSKRLSILCAVVTIVPGVVGLSLMGTALSTDNRVAAIVGGCLFLFSVLAILHNGLRYRFCRRTEDYC